MPSYDHRLPLAAIDTSWEHDPEGWEREHGRTHEGKRENQLRNNQQATQAAIDIMNAVYWTTSPAAQLHLDSARLHLDDTQDWTTPELEPDFSVTQIR